jgi:hypothetical protein
MQQDQARMHVYQLQVANFQLNQHAHQLGLASQHNKVALNNLQGQYTQLQTAYSESNSHRTKLEDELREERLNHEASKSALHSERYYHDESKKHNECLWVITKRIQELYSGESKHVGIEECCIRKMQFEIADLLIDNEEKQRLIESLRTELKDKSQGALCYEKEMEHRKNTFEAALADKDKQILELESSLQQAQVGQALLMRRKSTVRKVKRESTG